jgi:hypothetical protein
MSDSIWEVQKALYDELTGDEILMGQVTGIYDYVPQHTLFPYVRLAYVSHSDKSTAGATLYEAHFRVDIYAQERGSKQVLDIMAQVKIMLHNAALTATGCSIINIGFISSEMQLQHDGLTYHAVSNFRVLMAE